MERVSAAEKVVIGSKGEKKGHRSKKDKGKRKGKKDKAQGHGGDGDGSIQSDDMNHSVEIEQAEVLAEMAEKPCLEHAEDIMSKSDVKEDRKKKKKDKEADTISQKQILDASDVSVGSGYVERNMGKGEHDSMSKKGKRKHRDGETSLNGSCDDQIVSRGDKKKKRNERSITLEEGNEADMSMMGQKTKGKKKRGNERDNVGVDLSQNIPAGNGNSCNKEKKVNVAHGKDKGKRVSFTDDVEVFKIDGGGGDEEGDGSGDSELVHGQRFTHEEDVKLMEAIQKYSEINQLGDKGLEMIRECKKYPETRGCWAEIAKSLPHRPVMAVYKRARILLYRSDERKWTPEEYEIIRRFVEKNGTGWKELATELGKSEIHVKDTWRRMKPKNLKKGTWTQDEYQNLFDLVNLDLRVKAHQKIAPTHRQLRDNISWEAISEKLTTRNNKDCCLKWYQQLASPLVKEGIWADIDDYLLMEALQKGDAVCFEDVDWERLLDHRSGELCRQRWNQMVRMIGGHREKPFIEQVEVLARRYCPEMLDYRKPEASDLSPDELAGESDS
ncbi:hypothetical protein SETIT_7G320700v2 [Setaria italica]|uniref:Uncharacterized protein n=2 Tax=Setaria italica TaxID=4555 RepID=K3Y6B1_SETIT|nr:DNA-binding protein REB1 isoform X1 [Setaria italica]XP_004977531.1 DNA-binding protein REB1 isoform X1 [Setaria italica]RCV36456.1 hypothetical protein SETIT_7G320700v2 [Setaria italica]RCV36457.1 hypothetical protein SETIT_7G320700v2 [Setaria italica]